MSRYASKARWLKRTPGVYVSPCGRYRASKEGYSRWTLEDLTGRQTFGPFIALADCQDHVARLDSPLGAFR